jgi:hypothetical protein
MPPFVPDTTNGINPSRQCRPPWPNLFTENLIQADQPEIKAALQNVDVFIRESFVASQVDGLTVGIVASNGAMYETARVCLKHQ